LLSTGLPPAYAEVMTMTRLDLREKVSNSVVMESAAAIAPHIGRFIDRRSCCAVQLTRARLTRERLTPASGGL